MREIKLTQGKIAIVDDEDYDYLNQWKWHANNSYKNLWYALRKDSTNKNIQMHRIIMNAPPNMKVDHIDGGGRQHRIKHGGGSNWLRQLRKDGFPPGYRVLCYNYNSSYGMYGYCPHQK